MGIYLLLGGAAVFGLAVRQGARYARQRPARLSQPEILHRPPAEGLGAVVSGDQRRGYWGIPSIAVPASRPAGGTGGAAIPARARRTARGDERLAERRAMPHRRRNSAAAPAFGRMAGIRTVTNAPATWDANTGGNCLEGGVAGPAGSTCRRWDWVFTSGGNAGQV